MELYVSVCSAVQRKRPAYPVGYQFGDICSSHNIQWQLIIILSNAQILFQRNG